MLRAVNPRLDSIPDDMDKVGFCMAQSGFTVQQIKTYFDSSAKMSGRPITWTNSLIRSHYGFRSQGALQEGLNLQQFVDSRKAHTSTSHLRTEAKYCPVNGCIQAVFVELEGSRAHWAAGGDSNILITDVTYNIFKINLKLHTFATVDSLCKTVILSFSMLCSEETPVLDWSHKQFLCSVGIQPSVVFSDQGASLVLSIQNVFPFSKHFLCIWHL